MTGPDLNIICWNVRVLNTLATRRMTVHEALTSTTCHLACLQETILEMIDQVLALYLGGHNLCSYAHYKPVVGTRGGILLLWNDGFIETGQS